jgi:IS5 family transposase
LAPTLENAERRGLTEEIETIWLDRGYDSAATRVRLSEARIDDAVIAKKRKRKNPTKETKKLPMGLRWPVERTNSWLSNYGQLRRNTDRTTAHRLAQFALAVVLLLTAKLIDWRNRWSPTLSPIR